MNNIIENDLRRLDLNLLLAFRALMQERSVTLAAERLFLGQPAMSGALKRLRAAFQDELFVRTPQGMVPTPRAQELWRRFEPLLAAVHQAVTQPAGFVPAEASRVFRIGLTDSLGMALMPELMARLNDKAPGVQLICRQADDMTAAGMLDVGDIDLGIGVFKDCAPWQRLRRLFRWRFVCVYSAERIKPANEALTLAEFLRHRHLLTSFQGSLSGYIDEILADQGLRRDVVFSSPNFATNPFILNRIPAITTVPEFTARLWQKTFGLSVSPLPFAVPDYEVSSLWTEANDREPGLSWLVDEFADAFSDTALSHTTENA